MESARRLRICVIGAGAIGGFFGARLANGHAEVSAIARGRTLAALRDRGWTLESGGSRIVAPVRATDDASTLGTQDAIIVAVKAYALRDVAPLVRPLLGPSTIVLPALNGIPWWFALGGTGMPYSGPLRSADPDGTIASAIPLDSVIGSVVYPACSSPEPGVVRHHSGTRVVLGEIAGPARAKPSPRIESFVTCLRAAGFDAEASSDIRTEVWKKLLGNACFNPVSLLTGSTTDRMIDDPSLHALFVAMMTEVIAVGTALGMDAGVQPPERIAFARKLGGIKTSMLQDAEAGRPVEIEAILGTLVELADALDVSAPTVKTVYALALARARTLGLLKE